MSVAVAMFLSPFSTITFRRGVALDRVLGALKTRRPHATLGDAKRNSQKAIAPSALRGLTPLRHSLMILYDLLSLTKSGYDEPCFGITKERKYPCLTS